MQTDDLLTQTIDCLIKEVYKPTEPGCAVVVVKNDQIIFRQGYGMANLELGVPIEPDMVFRLGSITKQFTAIAILILVEQGKLSLDDSLTKFLPDYPTHDHLITVRHLLTHTSGIKSYTSMPEWLPLWRKDFTLPELIDFFKDQPIDFAPDERWNYSNSGYILLGAIIEKVSGQLYEEFIQQNIFEPLGMKQSYYDSTSRIIPRRVSGYEKGADGFANAAYLSMTQPHAAGSLVSTVDDLVLWDAALYTEKLLKHETIQQAHTSHLLADGASTGYGLGWFLSDYAGHRLVEHGGGINGFVTYAMRLPDDHIFVSILSNNQASNPELLAFKIAALMIGEPYSEPIAIALEHQTLMGYAGTYQTSTADKFEIICEDNHLFWQPSPAWRSELMPVSANQFFLKDDPLCYFTFTHTANEAATDLECRWRLGMPVTSKRIDKPAEL